MRMAERDTRVALIAGPAMSASDDASMMARTARMTLYMVTAGCEGAQGGAAA
jgi:hypothetical protein